MNTEIIGLLGLVILFVFLALGMPIGFAMALLGFVGFVEIVGFKAALTNLATVPYSQVASYTLSVLPLFIVMGEFASFSGLIGEAYQAMYAWLGRLPGGLAISTIGACAIFAAVCGSSIAEVTYMGTVAYPEMRRHNYDAALSLGSIAAGATLGILIPPSIPFVIYAIFAEESVGSLFLAGVIPGLILSLLFILTIFAMTKYKPSLGPRGPKLTWRERLTGSKGTLLVAALGLLVLGGIWGGIFSPTEAGGIGALGALIIGLARRRLKPRNIISSLENTCRVTAMCLTIIIGAMIFNYFITVTGLPAELAKAVQNLSLPPTGILVSILLIYLFLGCILDTAAMTVLTLPIFLPLLRGLHFDLVWFGVLFVIMCELAMITPPIGINVFVLAGVVDVPMFTVFRGIIPFIIPLVICIAIIVAFPQIALFLPFTMRG